MKSFKFPAQPTETSIQKTTTHELVFLAQEAGTAAWAGADFVAALRIIFLVLSPVSSPIGTSRDSMVSAAHSSEHSCYSKHVHQSRETSLLWHRELPAHLLHESKFPFTLFSSALLITEIFPSKIWICSRMSAKSSDRRKHSSAALIKLILPCTSPASSVSFVIMFAFPHTFPTFILVYILFSHELSFLLKKNKKQNTLLVFLFILSHSGFTVYSLGICSRGLVLSKTLTNIRWAQCSIVTLRLQSYVANICLLHR